MQNDQGRGHGQGGGGRSRARAVGLGGGYGLGPGGECVCPKCNFRAPHRLGVPCIEQHCPECGTRMTREM
ncbi:hypothetical protein [[Eubacterium] cellulosolvens]